MTSQNLPWISQELMTQTSSAFNNTHAILINGPASIGKTSLAARVCQQLLMQTTLIQAGTHPDLHVLTSAYSFNQLDQGLQNAATRYLTAEALEKKRLSRQISVESVRSLIAAMSESPALGGNKLVVISPAEDMNRNAANALLKFLEEPTDKTLIILISNDTSKLPATIRSRCMRIDMTTPAQAESVDWLKSIYPDHCEDEISNILRLACGRPLLANLYLQENQQSVAEDLTTDIERVVNGQANVVVVAKNWHKLKQTDFILHWLCCFFSDLIKFKSGHVSNLNRNYQSKLAQQLTLGHLFDLYDYFVAVNQHYDGVTDEVLMLEDLLLKVSAARH